MEHIIKQYEKCITDIHEAVQHYQNSQFDLEAIVDKQFKNIKPRFEKMNGGIKIVMDNQFGIAIAHKLKIFQEKQISDFKNFQKNLLYYSSLAKVAEINKFITKRQKAKLDKKFKVIKESKQYRLNCRLNALLKSDDKEEFREDFFVALGLKIEGNENDSKIFELYQQFYSESMKNMSKKLLIKLDSIISKFEDRDEILGSLLQTVDEYLGNEIGKDDSQLLINRKLIEIAESECLESNLEHIQNMRQQFNWIKAILDKFSSMKMFHDYGKIELKLAKFGSIVSGFATKNTDMDLTILTGCYINQLQLLRQLEKFIKSQIKNHKRADWTIKLIKDARIPLLQLIHTNSNGVQTHIDLIINNILGVINSRFLSVYGSVKWIKHLGLLIKQWGKGRNQSLIKTDMFSSYSFNLLLIHFLIETGRANLIIQARDRTIENEPHFIYKRKIKNDVEEFPVFFKFKTNKEDVTNLKRVNLYEVLTAFFQFYGSQGKHWKYSEVQRSITVDGIKREPDESSLFTIKDPFDEMHNPGRVGTTYKNKTMQCFDTAVEVLKSKNVRNIESLFE